MSKRLFFIFHGRFPSEKAAGLFAAESCRAFAAHMPVTLLVPRRLGRGKDPHTLYQLPASVRVVYLPTLDIFSVPLINRIAFAVSYMVFSFLTFVYLAMFLHSDDIVETNEALPALFATLLSRSVVYEVHDFPEHFLSFYRTLFRRVHLIVATNEWKKTQLSKEFNIPAAKVLMERNGVDTKQFAAQDKVSARTTLNLPLEKPIALYTGHLYSWKGVETLVAAARTIPSIKVYLVGGTLADIEKFKKNYADIVNLHLVGQRSHSEIPKWLAAADVLVLPNTAKEELSAHYTSPMKLFEYMASGRPIVASRLPSIGEVVDDQAVFFAEPDVPESFAAAIHAVLADPTEATHRAKRAGELVALHDWVSRAQRIIDAQQKS